MTRPLLILGPTASGKTALAVRLALEQGGEVINMDSMQVYADLFVLTARPTREEEGGIAHHLFGTVDAAVAYSTGAWVADALAAIQAVQARGARPILVGGTGLYAHALTEGLVETPPVPADIRAAVRKQAGADPRGAHARLRQVDPEAARRIEPKDAVRIARALEVYEATGRALSDWHAQPQPPALAPGSWDGLVLEPPREVLYDRIARRLDTMMEQGALDEARDLWERRLDPALPCLKAHGMPGFIAHFEGDLSLEAAVARAVLDTRHYAKRQLTWLRGRAADWPRFASDGS
jgi:tRNA dimethylallyltransferase